MLKRYLSIFASIFLMTNLFAQDIVVNKKGERFNCYISREDSTAVYFEFYRGETKIDSSIIRSDILNYQYGALCEAPIPGWHSKAALSGGFGLSGATYIGAEIEYLFARKLGVQVGGGVFGAGASLNYHFLPTIRSSYVALQYNVRGLGGQSFWGSNVDKWGWEMNTIGPAIVFRGRRWFTGQVSIGYVLKKGPAFREITQDIPVVLKFGIGAYLPFY